jgi:hypothetical protein
MVADRYHYRELGVCAIRYIPKRFGGFRLEIRRAQEKIWGFRDTWEPAAPTFWRKAKRRDMLDVMRYLDTIQEDFRY